MHFFRNEMLHDMRVSKKNQSKLVSYLPSHWISSYIHCSDISEGRFCQKKIAKSTRSADNHIVHSHIENCLFLFIKHLDFQKWFSIQLETMARGFQYLTLDFCNILRRASHDATESCKLQGFWGSGQILGKTWKLEVYIRLRIKYGQTLEFQLLIFPLVWTTRTTAVAQPKPMPKPSEGLLKKSCVLNAQSCCDSTLVQTPWFTAATSPLLHFINFS